MDDTATALPKRPRPPASGQRPRPASRRSIEPHHVRRRWLALAVLAAAALVVGVIAGAGSGGTTIHRVAVHGPGYFSRIQTLAGNGPGSFVAERRAAENAGIDRTLAYTPYIRVAGAQHREMALTFDDGPGPFTPQLVAELKRLKVPATFFEVGTTETDFHAGTSQILAAGFPVGDHTETHANLPQLSAAGQQQQIQQAAAVLGRWGVPYPRLFRPPYGLWNHTTLSLLRKYRMLMVLWTIDTSDYTRPGVDRIVQTVLSQARPGAIVLMHDAGGPREQTIAAVPHIAAALRARGYKLVTVPQLVLDNPPPSDQNIDAIVGSGG
jgi:peptidoglycan-N-acetylglucosamine deacetylase